MCLPRTILLITALLVSQSIFAQGSAFGDAATADDIQTVFWAAFPDGEYMPEGSGTAVEGEVIYQQQCLACHGVGGKDGIADRLLRHTADEIAENPKLKKTIGTYWPYAIGVFDYIRRAMPLTAPMSLSNDDYYALTAYLLYINGIVDESTLIDKTSLPGVSMPNQNGFINALEGIPTRYDFANEK